jgi:hypothetical protein
MALILGTVFSCRYFSFGREEIITYKEGSYAIESRTILDSLAQGKTDVFTSEMATPEVILAVEPVQWSQTDYLTISQALYTYVWGDSVEDWSLNRALFKSDCSDANIGIQYAHFKYYKVNKVQQRESRYVRDIYIDPRKNSVSWSESEYYPVLEHWQLINLEQLNVSADSALQIADSNGGFEARSNVENQCVIYLTLAPGSVYDDWQVSYTGNGSVSLFNMYIDRSTGEYKIVDLKP